VTDPLQEQLDRLFRLPPGELVEARNALADELKRAGDKAGAARVKAIKRAVPVAWAINQAWFEQPELLERAREVTHELRELHAQGAEAKRLTAAVEAQRAAMQAVVEAALRAGRGAGMSENTLQPRKVHTTVQAWLAGKGDDPPGRMTQELEASGFDAFAGMTLPASLPMPHAPRPTEVREVEPAPATHAADAAAQRAALEHAQRVVAQREGHAAAALELLQRREAEQATAVRALDQAHTSLREAERQLAELRVMLEQRARDADRRTAALDEARAQREQAEAAAATARAELAAISSEGSTGM
jgi:hypothetical protein